MDEMEPLYIKCKDGYSFWVYAGKNRGSWPKEYLRDGSYKSVEVYIPPDKDLIRYGTLYSGRYSRVPVDAVDSVITKHGGLA